MTSTIPNTLHVLTNLMLVTGLQEDHRFMDEKLRQRFSDIGTNKDRGRSEPSSEPQGDDNVASSTQLLCSR